MKISETLLDDYDTTLTEVIAAAAGLVRDWEHAFAEPIGPHTRLVADLGCQSLDIVILIADLCRHFGCTETPFERLLRCEGKPVSDLSLAQLANFLSHERTSQNPLYQSPK